MPTLETQTVGLSPINAVRRRGQQHALLFEDMQLSLMTQARLRAKLVYEHTNCIAYNGNSANATNQRYAIFWRLPVSSENATSIAANGIFHGIV